VIVDARVEKFLKVFRPKELILVDGSSSQLTDFKHQLVSSTVWMPVCYEDSYWTTSYPSDVARTEESTYVISDASLGPFIRCISRSNFQDLAFRQFKDLYRNKRVFVVPYWMGAKGSLFAKKGITFTDSLYVVLNMAILNKIDPEILSQPLSDVVFGLHSVSSLDPQKKYIVHDLENQLVFTVNSNYGGNVLVGKKSFALRMASWIGQKEGWLAEHMFITVVSRPSDREYTVLGALPSACGKTNLAMLEPPPSYSAEGWSVRVVGDDIAWLRQKDGYLNAVNPEYGFFGVLPGTSPVSNKMLFETMQKGNAIFTNSGLDLDSLEPWWEGKGTRPRRLLNWKREILQGDETATVAHPNSRVTCPLENCKLLHPAFKNPNGLKVDIILFGCRRARGMPLVFETRSIEEALYFALNLKSEKTSAQEGILGELRRDPFAMRPFLSYPISSYVNHWHKVLKNLANPPKIFFVNWFLRDETGGFIWPGFGENLRVLEWMIKRVCGEVGAQEGILGLTPRFEDLNLSGLALDRAKYKAIFEVPVDELEDEILDNDHFLEQFKGSICDDIMLVHKRLRDELGL